MKKPNIVFRGLARINLSVSSFWNLHKYKIEHCVLKYSLIFAIVAVIFTFSLIMGAGINAFVKRPYNYTGVHPFTSIVEGIASMILIALFYKLVMQCGIFFDWCDIQYRHAKTFEIRKKNQR